LLALITASCLVGHYVDPARIIQKEAETTKVPIVSTGGQPVVTVGFGCRDAMSYLTENAAPGWHFECPAYADGNQAMTCWNIAGLCADTKLIAIAMPGAAAYMNQASNSWVLSGLSNGPIDP